MQRDRSTVISGSLSRQNPRKTVSESHRLRMTAVLIEERGRGTAYPNLLLNKSFCWHDGKI